MSSKYKLGDTFGQWKVIDVINDPDNQKYGYRVECDKCGYVRTIQSSKHIAEMPCFGCKKGTGYSQANICFNCKKACGDCSWSQDFTPVEGWTADKVYRNVVHKIDGKNVYVAEDTGYHIKQCPLFEKEEPRNLTSFDLSTWFRNMPK